MQIVGRLFGIVTTTPDGAIGPLTGMAALALATRAALASAAFAFAFALAAVAVLALVCCCSLSSFCSSIFSCCFSSAISASLPPPADCE
ncbi:hypothetical protein ACVILK_001478 [Bradyrhizobium embrapense]